LGNGTACNVLEREVALGSFGEIAMSRYSVAKVDNEYVVQAEGHSILRLSSRRQADKLISALAERGEYVTIGDSPHQRCRNPQPPQPKRGPQ
jgi:CRISPR/Cas system endoribonuclease Cas6 (RAMP superfamily)